MPIVAEKPKNVDLSQDRQSTFAHPLARSILRLAIVLVIAAAISGGWYLARKGFGGRTRARIVEELHRRGVEASIARLTLNPFRGLVARNVRIFSYQDRTHTIAFISEIVLDINYAAFFHHQPFLNALDIRNAEVTLPLKGPQGKTEQPQLRRFHAHIYFPPEQIFVSQAEGILCGVRVSATGQLIKRADYQPSPSLSEEERQKRLSILRRVVSELQRFSFPNGPPSLQVKFSGDLAQLEDARGEATLQGNLLKRKDYEMRDFIASAEWSNQTLHVSRCEWNDRLGGFAATANWSRQTNAANFQARSSLDVKTLLDAADAGGALTDATFNSPAVIDVSGSANFAGEKPQIKLNGYSAVENIAYKNLPLYESPAEFSWDGERTWLRDIRIRHPTGDLRAEVFEAPNEFRLNIDGPVTPGEVRPTEVAVWIDPDLPKNVAPYKFHQPPAITANGVYQFRGQKGTRLEINVEAPAGLDYVFLGKTLPFHKIDARLLFTSDRLQIV